MRKLSEMIVVGSEDTDPWADEYISDCPGEVDDGKSRCCSLGAAAYAMFKNGECMALDCEDVDDVVERRGEELNRQLNDNYKLTEIEFLALCLELQLDSEDVGHYDSEDSESVPKLGDFITSVNDSLYDEWREKDAEWDPRVRLAKALKDILDL